MLVNRVKITADEIPSSYAVLSIWVTRLGSPGYSKTIIKTFTYGTPPDSSWVKILANKATTLQSLFENLVANDQDGNMVFSIDGDVLTIDFENPLLYNVNVINDAYGAYTVTSETFEYTEPVVPVDAFQMKHLQIEIIDTYENDLALQVEVTKASAPTLAYDGGDDIYEPLYTSNLKFNMRVADYADAYFLHLFTGDEKRFKVKLNAISEEEEVRLYWQGYLLPDMLREPYTNNNLFVDFEAIDMLASLKGKFLKPWQYYQRYNIATLFAMIFEQTGISQPMVIRPSIIPANAGINWRSMNVPLLTYVDGGKYTDLYTILTDVLQSNLLTCYSFKGTWYIDGVTRKNETNGPALYFDENGVFETQKNLYKEFISPSPIKDSLYFTAMTPWKTVTAEFDYKGEKNVLPGDVVVKENFNINYDNGQFLINSPATALMDYWKQVGAKMKIVADNSNLKLTSLNALPGQPYAVLEPEALLNYVELKSPVYLYANFEYEVEIELEYRVVQVTNISPETVTINPGFYTTINQLVGLQIIQNNVEILTNRSNPTSGLTFEWQYESATGTIEGGSTIVLSCPLKLKKRLILSQNGLANIRFIASVGNAATSGFNIEYRVEINPSVVKINVVNDEQNGFTGVRPINFTNNLTLPLGFISSPDQSILNNYGLGIQQTPYEEVIPVGIQTLYPGNQTFPNDDVLYLNCWLFDVTANLFKKMFKDGLLKSIYIVRASGEEEHFYSFYGKSVGANNWAYYLNDYDFTPIIPKDYKELAKIESGDVLKMALSNYPSENLNNRGDWKIYGESEIRSFMQTAIAACHNVRPSQLWVMEGGFQDLVWPDQIQQFYFDGQERNFINTRLTLDLFNGKTSVYGREFKYENLTDVVYE